MSNADIVTPSWLIQQTCRLVTMRPASGCPQSIDTPGRHRTFLAMDPTKNETQPLRDDPRHTFLKSREVIARFRWGRTRGYLELKKPGFPRPIGGNYRLDTLIAWEDRCLAGVVPQNDAITAMIPLAEASSDSAAPPTHGGPAELPQRSQSRRRRAA
jgi:hypothetical protein